MFKFCTVLIQLSIGECWRWSVFKSWTSSCCVVLSWFLTVSPTPRKIVSGVELLPFSNIVSYCWSCLTQLWQCGCKLFSTQRGEIFRYKNALLHVNMSWCAVFLLHAPLPCECLFVSVTWAESSSSHLWAESHLHVIFNQGSLQNPGHAPTPRQFVILPPVVIYIGSSSTPCLLPLILLWFLTVFYPGFRKLQPQIPLRSAHHFPWTSSYSPPPLQQFLPAPPDPAFIFFCTINVSIGSAFEFYFCSS